MNDERDHSADPAPGVEPSGEAASGRADGQSGRLSPTDRVRELRKDLAAATAVALIGFAAVVSTYRGVGWTWDESYYLPAARLTLAWTRLALSDGLAAARSPEAMAKHWGGDRVVGTEEHINELPGLCKWLWAAGLLLFENSLGAMAAMRLPTALAFGILLATVFALAREANCGRGASLFGALCLLAMPRVFGHAHLGATDIVMALMAAATTLAFARACRLGGGWRAALVGVLFGAALATKINAFFLFPALFLWGWTRHPARFVHAAGAMIFLGPVVFAALWPWLWIDTPARVLSYLSFHARHQITAVFYFGTKYGYDAGNAPVAYPFVMLLLTTPPLVLSFIAGGVGRWLRRPFEPVPLLFAIQAAIPLLIIAMPSQPKYDGVRLFLPAYPFLAAFCALALDEVARLFEAKAPTRAKLVAPIACAVVAVAGIYANGTARPFYLSYFNAFIGGVEGAWERGLETTYWGDAANEELLAWLNDERNVPRGSSIAVRAMFDRVLRDYQAWGMLRKDLVVNPPLVQTEENPNPRYDFHLINARRGFWGDIDWRFFAKAHRAKFVLMHRGAPMLFVFGSIDALAMP